MYMIISVIKYYCIVKNFGGKNFWQIEVHLQFDFMSHTFKCQSMDMHIIMHGTVLTQYTGNPKPYSTGNQLSFVLQEIGLVLHVQ